MLKDGEGSIHWTSKSTYPKTLRLNLYEKHFSLIKNINTYANSFVCDKCNVSYSKASALKQHKCLVSSSRLIFPNECYGPKRSIFDELEDRTGIFVPYQERISPIESHMTYDMNHILIKRIYLLILKN